MKQPRRVPRAVPDDFDANAPSAPGAGIFGLPCTVEESRVVLVPVPFEATASYGSGAAGGPGAILRASQQVDLHDHETGDPYRVGIAMDPIPQKVRRWNREARKLARPILAAGGEIGGKRSLQAALRRVDGIGDRLNQWVRERSAELLRVGKLPAIVGGDHSVAFGAIQACAEATPDLGILHVDAHADLREAYGGFTWSHASVMYNVITHLPRVSRLVQVGLRDVGREEVQRIRKSRGRIQAFYDADLSLDLARGKPFASLARTIVEELPRNVYLSFDIDGLDPTLCPGTGTPVPGGLSWHQATILLATLAGSGRRVVGLDLCEVAPRNRGDQWDGNVGARLLYKMIGFALLSAKSKRRRDRTAPTRSRRGQTPEARRAP